MFYGARAFNRDLCGWERPLQLGYLYNFCEGACYCGDCHDGALSPNCIDTSPSAVPTNVPTTVPTTVPTEAPSTNSVCLSMMNNHHLVKIFTIGMIFIFF